MTLQKPGKRGEPGARLDSREIGALGEQLAALFLERREGFSVLHRNFRAPRGGEVDLVCREGTMLAFVEVKTRTAPDRGRPADAVNREKRALITRGALHWLQLLNRPAICFRFDIVEVILEEGKIPRFNLIREAFHLPEPHRY